MCIQILCSLLSFTFRLLQRHHNMSTKSLNQEVLNNRFMLSFKMLYGKYQYIVENYWQVSSNSKVAIVSLVCLKMAYYLIFRWCFNRSYITYEKSCVTKVSHTMHNVQDCSSLYRLRFRFMVFNAIFVNISVISWRSALLVGDMEYPDKILNLSQVTEKTSTHNVVLGALRHEQHSL